MSTAISAPIKPNKKLKIPDGWSLVKLGKVIRETQTGFACGDRDSEGIVQLRMNNLNTLGNFNWNEVLRVPREGNKIEPFLLLSGDVVFNNTNSTELVGKSALFSGYSEPVVYSNHFTRLRTVSGTLLPDYLAFWLNHQWQQGVFASICNKWIGQSGVKANKLLSLEIPLPPLDEQKRILGILSEQMTEIDRTRLASQECIEAIEAMPAALLRQVFPSPNNKLPKGWQKILFADVLDIVSGQVDPTDHRYRDLPHVNGTNIESGTGRLMNIKSAAEDHMTSGKYLFESGVVLYSKLRPYLKKAALANFRGLCSADMYPILPNTKKLTSAFLLQILLSESFTAYAESESQRARMPKLNRKQLLAYLASIPPLEEQQQITAMLKEQMAEVEKARIAAEVELDTINALPASFLRQAFNGEI